MSHDKVQRGFELWSREVHNRNMRIDEVQIPLIALAGIYSTFTTDKHRLTSYNWRQTVLKSPGTMQALSTVLPETMEEYLVDDYEILLTDVASPSELDVGIGTKEQLAQVSILDGVPPGVETILMGEYFLGRTLGHASYDYALKLQPLRITRAGQCIIEEFFPQTAELVKRSAL